VKTGQIELRRLHQKMFGNTWLWGARLRTSNKKHRNWLATDTGSITHPAWRREIPYRPRDLYPWWNSRTFSSSTGLDSSFSKQKRTTCTIVRRFAYSKKKASPVLHGGRKPGRCNRNTWKVYFCFTSSG